MNEQEIAARMEVLEGLIEILIGLGFEKDSMRAALTAQAHASYLRYVEEASFGNDRVIYTIECAFSRSTPDFRGYTARLLPAEGNAERSHFFSYTGDYHDIHSREAYNLLCGRAVIKFQIGSVQPTVFVGKWNILGPDGLRELPEFDFGAQLRAMPLSNGVGSDDGFRVIYQLIRGDRVPVTLDLQGIATAALLEADPSAGTVRVLTTEGRPLDWKQGTQNPADEATEKRSRQRRDQHKRRQGPKH